MAMVRTPLPIRAWKAILRDLGYVEVGDDVTDDYTEALTSAVKAFQQDVVKNYDPATLPVGPDSDPGRVDGILGRNTKRALITVYGAWQAQQGGDAGEVETGDQEPTAVPSPDGLWPEGAAVPDDEIIPDAETFAEDTPISHAPEAIPAGQPSPILAGLSSAVGSILEALGRWGAKKIAGAPEPAPIVIPVAPPKTPIPWVPIAVIGGGLTLLFLSRRGRSHAATA